MLIFAQKPDKIKENSERVCQNILFGISIPKVLTSNIVCVIVYTSNRKTISQGGWNSEYYE